MFYITSNTKIKYSKELKASSLLYAERCFYRDMKKTLNDSLEKRNSINIELEKEYEADIYSWEERKGNLYIKVSSSLSACYPSIGFQSFC